MQAIKYQIYAHHLISIVFFWKPSRKFIRPQFL